MRVRAESRRRTLAVHCYESTVAANLQRIHRTFKKAQLLDGAMGVFLTPAEKRESQGPSVKDMQAKIGQLALENDFLAGALGRIDGASAKK